MKKWQIIDLARSFSIIVVMADHSYRNAAFNSPWLCLAWGRLCHNGMYGVFLFFIVSGFLITHVIDHNPGGLFKPSLRKFYVQRAGRIWPLFFLYSLAGVLIFLAGSPIALGDSPHFPAHADYDLWFWLSIPVFMFNWFLSFHTTLYPFPLYWNILWSLSVEEQFYFLYPAALKKITNERNFSFLLFAIIGLALVWRGFFSHYDTANKCIQSYASPGSFDLIAIGILLYLAVKRWRNFFSRNKAIGAGLCIAGLALILATLVGTQSYDRLSQIFAPELMGLGLFAFLLGGLPLAFFESKALKLLSFPGKYCFGCYLIHPTVLAFMRPCLLNMGIFSGLLFFVAVTTTISAVSYHFFEMPSNRFIRGTFGKS